MEFMIFSVAVISALMAVFMVISVFTAGSLLPLVLAAFFGIMSRWAWRELRNC